MKGNETILPKTQITTTYDQNGNLITEVKEDYGNNKITITFPEYYLTGSTEMPTQKPQLPQGEYKIEIYQTNTATTALTETKINLIQMPFNLIFYHHDHLGTTRYITNENGEILHTTGTLAYGEELTAPYENEKDEVLNTITYTGHEKDYETGLTYMLARYYSQGYGRFLSPDPGYDYDQLDPMSWNLYAYVRGNPINFDDPSGMVVNVSGLNEKEQQQLISDLQKITGYKSIEVDKDGNLQIGANGEYEGGSEKARKDLETFIDDKRKFEVVNSARMPKISVDSSEKVSLGRASKKIDRIAIDFSDFQKLHYVMPNESDKLTNGIGMIFFHEMYHKAFGTVDEPALKSFPGRKTSMQMCNQIRKQLGLPIRTMYKSPGFYFNNELYRVIIFDRGFIYFNDKDLKQ